MIGIDDLISIVKVALVSSRLKNELPLSILLIGSVGSGKSQILRKFAFIDGVYYCTDSTAYAIHTKHGAELVGGTIRHIVLPDLLNILNKPREQADAFITFLNSLIEEGIAKVESRNSNFSVTVPVRVGLITAIAYQDFMKRRQSWSNIGFLSRMLPIRFRYKQETIAKILESVIIGEYKQEKDEVINVLPDTEVELPEHIGRRLIRLANRIKDPDDETGARRLKQLIVFSKAHALLHNKQIVDMDDLAELARLSVFMRPPQTLRVKDRHNKDIETENPVSYEAI